MTKDEALRLALEALDSASNAIESWGSYASEYFQDKHDLQVDINNTQQAIITIKAALEAKDEPDAYGYAKRLAEAIWSKHYKTIAPQWEPFDELIGVLTQIDNMTVGLISTPQQEANDEIDWKDMYEKQKRHSEMWVAKYEKDIGPLEKAVPQKEAKDKIVAWVYPEFWQHLENLNCGTAYRLSGIGRQPLYTTPPQRKPLTDDEIEDVWASCEVDWDDKVNVLTLARGIESAHGIKGEA